MLRVPIAVHSLKSAPETIEAENTDKTLLFQGVRAKSMIRVQIAVHGMKTEPDPLKIKNLLINY